MDSITQMLVSQYNDVLNIGFVCNLMIFSAVLEGISVAIGHIAKVGQ